MRRRYVCYYDTGHDFGEFVFYSEHRAGSKANKEDARKEMLMKFGIHSNKYVIRKTFLDIDEM